MSDKLSHVDSNNQPTMVDVSSKSVTSRTATASAKVILGESIMAELKDGDINLKKGPVFQTAIIAGTMAAKKTWDLIPFCHPLNIEKCKITIEVVDDQSVEVLCSTALSDKTGVEMEALTGASVAALTIYDMCKAMSKSIVISEIKLIEKKGGKSDYTST